MLKIFSTQLSGVFKRIHENEELSIEEGARLLAQAIVGDGHVYFIGFNEMNGITVEALEGAEPFLQAKKWEPTTLESLTELDRVLLMTRFSHDGEAIQLAKQLQTKGIPFVVISAKTDVLEKDLEALADVHLNTTLTRGLLPGEDGERYGMPTTMAVLFAYYGLKFAVDEMVNDY